MPPPSLLPQQLLKFLPVPEGKNRRQQQLLRECVLFVCLEFLPAMRVLAPAAEAMPAMPAAHWPPTSPKNVYRHCPCLYEDRHVPCNPHPRPAYLVRALRVAAWYNS